ncbi:aldehyde dehydrogenase family protein [Falsiroseomonas selenitidurans]|uniref:Aldehyde dehydrogenase family protein n=1 Tax=Falsiroseomonas selenitidurans TaxID=2716335 RepID=A0ABX1DZE1_9PROT|nr:aldehyde dehydrogenase family protein [Falsiroseomonas selenitidurans]NKC30275.1 aldehyde dehydrogenase family protein [Falsiroseomonas selenitidurans]
MLQAGFQAERVLEAEIARLLGGRIGSVIDGQVVDGQGAGFTLQDPATGRAIARYADAGPALATAAAAGAARAQRAWMALSAAERGRRIWALGALLRRDAESLARLESANAGKPLRDCRAQVARVAEMAEYWAGWCDKIEGRTVPVPSGHTVIVRREPMGVVLAITPWNAPLFTCGWNVLPAIAAGNAVVLKPSEYTPLTSLAFGLLAVEAGLPPGLVQVVAGLGATSGQALLGAAEVAMVTFVGGAASASHIAAACAARMIPCVLELGGKSANIVFDDADLPAAVQGAQQAIFASSGQSCVAGSRLLVHRAIHDHFVALLASASARIRAGDPLDAATEIGPVATARQFAHVTGLVAAGVAEGATLLAPPRPACLPEDGFWVMPSILAGLDNQALVARTEIFGPVVAAIPFEEEAEAIALANATPFGLAGAVWTRDLGRAHRVAAGVRAGSFWVNGYGTIHVSVPFGGFGASGHGRSSGQEALAAYTQSKAVWVETAASPALGFGHRP